MSYLKDREIWLSNVPTGNPPAGYFWKFIQNGKVVVRDSSGNNQIMVATSGSQAITGSLTVTGGITGTATTASYVEYSNIANRPALVSGSAQIAAFGYATTGSNGFNGNQSITGSLTVTGQVVAQTLNVQQVTSSIVFSSGSNIFGNSLANTQQLTGSVGVTGSLTVAGAGTFSNTVTSTIFDSTSNAFRLNGNNALSLVTLSGQNVVKINAAGYWGSQIVGANDQGILVNNVGNVFIGSTSGTTLNDLTNRLSVSSTSYNLFDISRFSNNAFGPNFYLVKSRNGTIGSNTIVESGDNLGNIIWTGANGTGFTDAATIRVEVDGTPGASNDMPGRLVFSTTADGSGSPTERMRITSGGDLIFNPNGNTSYFYINQGTGADGGLLFRRNSSNRWQVASSTPGDNLLFYSYGISNPALTLNYSTGAATFSNNVNVSGDIQLNSTFGTLKTSTNGSVLVLLANPSLVDNEVRIELVGRTYPSGNAIYYRAATHIFTDSNASTERMRITSTGRTLLLGSSSSGWSDANRALLELNHTGSALLGLRINGDQRAYFYHNNTDLYIEQMLNPGRIYVISVSGGVYLTAGATSWTANSDERLKNINGEIENAVDKLSQLRAVNFSWKNNAVEKQNLGLIAQDVEKVFPELIDKNKLPSKANETQQDETEYLGVRYQELIPVLVKAIQEQQTLIESLKSRIEILEQ